MSGTTARRGFGFQDLILLERVLRYAVDQRRARIEGEPEPVSPLFGVEAALPALSGLQPEWDLLLSSESGDVCEEVKGGHVERRDRCALWSRIRDTVLDLKLEEVDQVRPQLTVSVDSGLPAYWGDLPRAAATIQPAFVDAVRNANDLAAEALHTLTRDQGLSIQSARSILSRFTVERRVRVDIESSVHGLVGLLALDLAVDEVVRALRGFIAERAEGDGARKRFRADEAIRSVEMLDRLSSVTEGAAQLWRRLRGRVAQRREVGTGGGLPYVPWERVTGDLPGLLRTSAATVVIGRGGLGKSVLLEQLVADWDLGLLLSPADVEGVPAEQLAESLRLGAFVSRAQERDLLVGLDALENATYPRELLGVLRPAVGDYRVVATCRANEWRSICGTQEGVRGWDVVELAEWSEDVVRDNVDSSQRPAVSNELLSVLRTPLFLDLFLRTFGTGSDVPRGLQSRHGLLREYWRRRVVPDDDMQSADRDALLAEISSSEMAGESRHRVDASRKEACSSLTSEGVLRVVDGKVVFRHPLLRDFALMRRIMEEGSSEKAISSLHSIAGTIVRYGALRAVVEAVLESQPDQVQALLAGADKGLLSMLAVVLAELEDPTTIVIPQIADVLGPTRAPRFLEQLVLTAVQSRNDYWLQPIARAYQHLIPFLGPSLLEHLAALAERAGPSAPPGTAAMLMDCVAALGRAVTHPHQFAVRKVIGALVRVEPSDRVLRWLLNLVDELGEYERNAVLEAIPVLASGAITTNRPLDGEALVELYVKAANMLWSDATLASSDEPSIMRDYYRFDVALLGSGSRVGLRSARPDVFLRIALAIIAGSERREIQRSHDRLASVPTFAVDLEYQRSELEERALQEAQRWPSPFEKRAPRRVPWSCHKFHPDGHGMSLLLSAIRDEVRSPASFVREFWPLVRATPCFTAKVLLLEALVREGGTLAVPLDELLQEASLYTDHHARAWTQKAIALRWANWTTERRHRVLEMIVGVAHDDPYVPGPLLNVIPRHERPPELEVFLELYNEHGRPLELTPPAVPRLATHRVPQRVASLANARDPIDFLTNCNQSKFTEPSETDWSEVLTALRWLLGNASVIPRNDQALLSHLMMFAERHDEHRKFGSLSDDELATLCTWSFESLSQAQQNEPFNVGLWERCVDLADALLRTSALRRQDDPFQEFFRLLDKHTSQSEIFAERALTWVSVWFHAGGAGAGLLAELLCERVKNGDALYWAVRRLGSLGVTEHERVLRTWLLEDGAAAVRVTDEFARHVGMHIGYLAVKSGPGGTECLGELARSLMRSRPASGPLANHWTYRRIASQAVFGARCAVGNGHVSWHHAGRYRDFVMECWSALGGSVEGSFALWAFAPALGNDATDRAAWWRILKMSILRVLREGEPSDFFSIVHRVSEPEIHRTLPISDLLHLLRGASARLETEYEESHMRIAINDAARLCESLVQQPTGRRHADELFQLVSAWAAPPMSNEVAIAAARRLRNILLD